MLNCHFHYPTGNHRASYLSACTWTANLYQQKKMFSCLLFQARGKSETGSGGTLMAASVNVDFLIVSNAGRGTAECRYAVEKEAQDLVVCVPSAISSHGDASSTQQQLTKVTKCSLETEAAGSAATVAALRLTKLDGGYCEQAPDYRNITKSLKRTICSDDLILYLGHFEAGTTIVLRFEFLLQLKVFGSQSSASEQHHLFENTMPAESFSYKLRHAFHVPVLDVFTSSPSSASSLDNFNWFYADRAKQVVQVSFNSHSSSINSSSNSNKDNHHTAAATTAKTTAFVIKVAKKNHIQSACCSCLIHHARNKTATNAVLSSSSIRHHSPPTTATAAAAATLEGGEYDGIMMLSSKMTRDQILVGGQGGTNDRNHTHHTLSNTSATPTTTAATVVAAAAAMAAPKHKLYPSELVFLVDCSGSMNPFIDSVIATLITCIKNLPKDCYLNLIAFGSTFRQLFHKSMPYSELSVRNAVDFAKQLKANLGGTELLRPLKWVYKTARKWDIPCQVFIITDVDQEVKDVPYMLSTIKKHRHHTR